MSYHVVLCYKSSAAALSHTGLGNCALGTAKVLQQNGIYAIPLPATSIDDVTTYMQANPGVTHVVFSALWVPTAQMSAFCDAWPTAQIAVICHSNIAFLQAEPAAIVLFREMLALEQGKFNFHAAGNSEVFCNAIRNAYQRPCTLLPNLYYLDEAANATPPLWQGGGTLRLGLFGSMRDQKNVITNAMGALILATRLKAQANLYVSTGRNDGGAAPRLYQAMLNLVGSTPYLNVISLTWQSWPQFITSIGSMHLNFQCSTSESFNQVGADSMSQGVPIVVSDAITWAPPLWRAHIDDATSIAKVGVGLLQDPSAGRDGMAALQEHNADGLQSWMSYIVQNQIGHKTWPANGVPLRFQGHHTSALGTRGAP